MLNQKVLIGFSNYKDTDFDQKAQHILQSMTGNANFPTPVPTLSEVQTGITNYSASLAKAVDGSKQDTVLKNQARTALEELLHNLGMYVQLNSKNDPAIMLSSGFDVSKIPTPVGILPKPDGFSVTPSASKGNVDLYVHAIYGAKSYQYEYAETPITSNNGWHVVTNTATEVTINNLQSGKEYAFRVAGIGADPTRTYSDVITSFVL
ncbi:MAG TPA: fibronectin type III domain-containing protein [Chitinophagaceae bacterium]|nr:fibronectin type III domain-containing protein [Chitinophagaceae bacterium]